ncbi:DJ-1/PfpI family protein [Polycladidibacter stylochi]|uniref:DJ-1/PfpI family protein n=1 Tax=Polycladidibacter stylochi TaxID=1807766 RepID=UPI00082AF597|nr:DJ-1/PfpI family protein [Pseudovibrio stylochi]
MGYDSINYDEARTVHALVYQGVDMLDLVGPLEMFAMIPFKYKTYLVAETLEPIISKQGIILQPSITLEEVDRTDMVLVPGGQGAGDACESGSILRWLCRVCLGAETVMSVCTGAAILARAGVLNGKAATSNKKALAWVAAHSQRVRWKRKARWVEDGKFFTSSGITAGMDMALAVIAKQQGVEAARETASYAEYQWNEDPSNDLFATTPSFFQNNAVAKAFF